MCPLFIRGEKLQSSSELTDSELFMLGNQWAENYWSISTVSPKTLFDYKGIYRRTIQPLIGETDLNDATLLDLQKMVIAEKPYSVRLA
jgi:hypothetical protein